MTTEPDPFADANCRAEQDARAPEATEEDTDASRPNTAPERIALDALRAWARAAAESAAFRASGATLYDGHSGGMTTAYEAVALANLRAEIAARLAAQELL